MTHPTRADLEEQLDMARGTLEGLAQASAELRFFQVAAAEKSDIVARLEEEAEALAAAAAIIRRREQLLEQVLENFPNLSNKAGRDPKAPAALETAACGHADESACTCPHG